MMKRLSSIEELQRFQQAILDSRDPMRMRVRICMTGCRAFGAVEVRDAFKASRTSTGQKPRQPVIQMRTRRRMGLSNENRLP